METYFNLNGTHTIYAAFANYYRTGACHPDRVMPMHDFVYILEGGWIIKQDGIPYKVGVDDVIVLTAGAHHGGSVPCENGTRTIYIHTSAGENERLGLYNESKETIPLSEVIHCRKRPEIKQLFMSMTLAFATEDCYRYARMDALFRSILFGLYDAGKNGNEFNGLVYDVMQTLRDNPERFYTNEDLASLHFVCAKTMVNRFRAQIGMTPYQYQMRYKLENIATILNSEPNRRLKDLAYDFGFYDEFHLSHAFKKRYGVSPEKYKRFSGI